MPCIAYKQEQEYETLRIMRGDPQPESSRVRWAIRMLLWQLRGRRGSGGRCRSPLVDPDHCATNQEHNDRDHEQGYACGIAAAIISIRDTVRCFVRLRCSSYEEDEPNDHAHDISDDERCSLHVVGGLNTGRTGVRASES